MNTSAAPSHVVDSSPTFSRRQNGQKYVRIAPSFVYTIPEVILMIKIDSLDAWLPLSEELSSHGYRLWQMQYGIDRPEGFIARFYSDGMPAVEIVTFDAAVREAVLAYDG